MNIKGLFKRKRRKDFEIVTQDTVMKWMILQATPYTAQDTGEYLCDAACDSMRAWFYGLYTSDPIPDADRINLMLRAN